MRVSKYIVNELDFMDGLPEPKARMGKKRNMLTIDQVRLVRQEDEQLGDMLMMRYIYEWPWKYIAKELSYAVGSLKEKHNKALKLLAELEGGTEMSRKAV